MNVEPDEPSQWEQGLIILSYYILYVTYTLNNIVQYSKDESRYPSG